MSPRPRADVAASAHDEIRVMTREARRAGAINLAQGVGELPVLPEAVDAAVAALRGGQHGTPSARAARSCGRRSRGAARRRPGCGRIRRPRWW